MTKTLFKQYSVITLILSIYPATTYPQDFYKWVDASGSTHYSATPPPSSAKKLGSVSTYSNSLEQTKKQLPDNKPVQNLNQPSRPVAPKDEFTTAERAEIEKQVPAMPAEVRVKLNSISLDSSQVESIISEPNLAYFVCNLIDDDVELAKIIANWVTGEIAKLVIDSKLSWSQVVVARDSLISIAKMIKSNKLSSTNAKLLLLEVIVDNMDPSKVAEDRGLLQDSDESSVEKIVISVINDNPDAVNDIKNGETKAIGYLVGQVMAKSQGKANPALAKKLLESHLELK